MTDLEHIEKHMVERFEPPDQYVKQRMNMLQREIAFLTHRVLCLQNENRGLRGILELLRREQEGVRNLSGS